MAGVDVIEVALICMNALQVCFFAYLAHKERLAVMERRQIAQDLVAYREEVARE